MWPDYCRINSDVGSYICLQPIKTSLSTKSAAADRYEGAHRKQREHTKRRQAHVQVSKEFRFY